MIYCCSWVYTLQPNNTKLWSFQKANLGLCKNVHFSSSLQGTFRAKFWRNQFFFNMKKIFFLSWHWYFYVVCQQQATTIVEVTLFLVHENEARSECALILRTKHCNSWCVTHLKDTWERHVMYNTLTAQQIRNTFSES